MAEIAAGDFGDVLLPEYVFLELVTVLAKRRDIQTARSVGDRLLGAADLRFVPCSDVFTDAYELFRVQPAATLSFVDAAIVAVCRRLGARRVATFDAGFRTIPDLVVVPA